MMAAGSPGEVSSKALRGPASGMCPEAALNV
jgi:hypothetical protein